MGSPWIDHPGRGAPYRGTLLTGKLADIGPKGNAILQSIITDQRAVARVVISSMLLLSHRRKLKLFVATSPFSLKADIATSSEIIRRLCGGNNEA